MPRRHPILPHRHSAENDHADKLHFMIPKMALPRNGDRTKSLAKRTALIIPRWSQWLERNEEWLERNKTRKLKERKNPVKKHMMAMRPAQPLPFANSAMMTNRFRFVSFVDVVFALAKKTSKSSCCAMAVTRNTISIVWIHH